MSPQKHIFPGQEARLRFSTQSSWCITGDNFVLLSSPRCHQGRGLGSDEDVHATPQHRGKIAPLHQVSVICVFLFFLSPPSPVQFSLLCYLGEDCRLTFLSLCHSPLSAFVCRGNKSICYSSSRSLSCLSSLPCSALMEGLVTPLQDRIEEWKKTANQLDKDHAKGQWAGNTRRQ